ncbi:MAG TPA: hypothetical protein VK603_12990, partial [Candidatus Saccharimonadales bacterium]|nr:hypothetical protein [Candidatus Saccharimonadales bacterium]
MAKVYFVKSGEVQGEKFVTDKPLEFCFDVLGLRVWKWHSPVERNGPFILSTNEDSTSKNDRHRIDVKRKSGPYRELRIEVRDAPIEVNEMIVTFGDGNTFRPKINARFREGRGSHVINLPGNRRSIDGVEFMYHSI